MAETSEQPKKRGISCLGWLGIGIVVLLIILFLMRACNNDDDIDNTADTSTEIGATTPNTPTNDTTVAGRIPGAGNYEWRDINQNAPAVSYGEIRDKNINVRGDDNYGIYSLGEDILFDSDKSTLKQEAAQNLTQIAVSINKRFKGGEVRIYGFTDSLGSATYNQQLAAQRAAAVRSWLASNGGIDSNRILVQPIGEGRPVASNSTAQGRQQNRRVEIIARKP
jgi:outer membrane protein OmpA-like peptidoglycan-associated protein